MGKRRLTASIGSIFRDVVDKQQSALFAKKIWNYVKDQLFKSMNLISYRIENNVLMHLLDIIDDIVISQMKLLSAKL